MRCLAVCLLVLFTGSAAAADAEPETLTIGYASVADDPRHVDFRGYANIVLRPAADPFAGARTALSEARIIGRALNIEFDLRRARGDDAASLRKAVETLHADGVDLFLLDAPGDMLATVATETRELDVLLFNVTAPDNALRESACQPHLLHSYPSLAMLADGLVQFAVSNNWGEVLVLQGPQAEDKVRVEAFLASARRFGLDVTEVREFSQTNDPRERSRNNIALLTQGDYDAVYVADAVMALGRHVPYQTRIPRPVFGDQGLMAGAWHWSAERYGAPQLNQRFERIANRQMNGKDWAAWAAVRLIVDAVRGTRSTGLDAIRRFLLGEELKMDTYKGSPGSIRAWNGQLRQPILLHTENAVIDIAPFDGFLHPTHNLDTLGRDQAESDCESSVSG